MSSHTLDSRTSRSRHSRHTVAVFAALGLSGIGLAADMTMVAPDQLQKIVEVRDVSAQPDQVSGVLVNLSSKPVRSIEIRIDRLWLWTDELHPGEDNPGRTIFYTVPGEIPPGGRLAFTYRPDVPFPERRDGRFETSVSVFSLEQMG